MIRSEISHKKISSLFFNTFDFRSVVTCQLTATEQGCQRLTFGGKRSILVMVIVNSRKMAIHLNFNAKAAQNFAENSPAVHYMPCQIKSDGPANVSQYFKPMDNEKDKRCKDRCILYLHHSNLTILKQLWNKLNFLLRYVIAILLISSCLSFIMCFAWKSMDVICFTDKTASFRGRPLIGEAISLPSGFKGLVVQETKQPLVENVERTMHVSNIFDELTYWNWDKTPSPNDPFISALNWIDVSKAVSSP